MNGFKEIKPQELDCNTFKMIGDDWLLISAQKDGKCNSMTASWGGLGILWNKPVAFIFIRPQRFTKQFVDGGNTFSLTVLPGEYRETYKYLGTASGYHEDKMSKAGLTILEDNGTPYFEEANTVLICRKLYAQDLDPECMTNDWVDSKVYPDKDYHTLYVAEVEKVLVK